MIKTILIFILCLFTISCSYQKKDKIRELEFLYNKLTNQDISYYKDLSISARSIRDDKFIVYWFVKYLNNNEFIIPNFKYCTNEECLDSSKSDVVKYANLNGINKDKAYDYVKHFSDLTLEKFQELGIYKIHSIRQSSIIVFYLDNRNYLAYIPEKENIKLDFWKEVIKSNNKFNDTWYYITED